MDFRIRTKLPLINLMHNLGTFIDAFNYVTHYYPQLIIRLRKLLNAWLYDMFRFWQWVSLQYRAAIRNCLCILERPFHVYKFEYLHTLPMLICKDFVYCLSAIVHVIWIFITNFSLISSYCVETTRQILALILHLSLTLFVNT